MNSALKKIKNGLLPTMKKLNLFSKHIQLKYLDFLSVLTSNIHNGLQDINTSRHRKGKPVEQKCIFR